jgi:RNA polymerase sigma factor (sigma-70 family)
METPDRTLLEEFMKSGKEAAFEELMKRHAPMVMGVCRRKLSDAQDAEEAFQMTFLVLSQKAPTIQKADSIGSWLYGVAYRTAHNIREKNNLSRNREKEAVEMIQNETNQDPNSIATLDQIQSILDEELNALPEKYKAPLVLCYLEGKSYGKAADELQCSHGQVRGKLEQAREMLRSKIVGRGVVITSAALATILTETSTHAAGAGISTALMQTTLKSALVAAKAAGVGIGSTSIIYSTKELLAVMATKKILAAAAALTLITIGAGGAFIVEKSSSETALTEQLQKYQKLENTTVSRETYEALANDSKKLLAENQQLQQKLQQHESASKAELDRSSEIASLKQQVKQDKEAINKPIPTTATEMGRAMGLLKLKMAELIKQFPKGPPADGTQEYADYISHLDDIMTDLTPFLTKSHAAMEKMENDPSTLAELVAYDMEVGLSLNENQVQSLKAILPQIVTQDISYEKKKMSATPQEVQKMQKDIYSQLSSQVLPVLTPAQQDNFKFTYPNFDSVFGINPNFIKLITDPK